MNLNIKHPKYYKELRKRNKSDQAISDSTSCSGADSVRPGPGPSTSLGCRGGPNNKPQATSSQAASDKLQAPSNKRQASSRKRQAP